MEHRYYPRMQVSLEVDVFKKDNHIGNMTTKDISLGGMKLQSDGFSLGLNGVVLLRISIQGEEYLISGFVVHNSKETTGIMFYGMSRDTTRAYFKLLSELDIPLQRALVESDIRSD
ncbi:MAG: PilZ domain-containing protein [Candidatus Thiodiazotropha sp. 6PLUC2]